MTHTQRVPAPRVPLRGHGELATVALVAIVAVLIAKPWGSPAAEAAPTAAPWAPTPRSTPAPTLVQAGYAYDQSVFGPFEPAPEWSVWPAGFFVTVLYVTREANEAPSAGPSPATSAPPAASSAGPSAPAPDPGWPALITSGPGDHLLWLGLNTPVDRTVRTAALWRLHDDGTRSTMPVVRLASEWGPYFAVIGIPVAAGSDRLAIWPQGTYEVAVTLDPGGESREIRVEIETLEAD